MIAAARKRSVAIVEAQGRPHEQELTEGLRVERDGDFGRNGLDIGGAGGPAAGRRPGRRDARRGGIGRHPLGEGEPARGIGVPGEAQGRQTRGRGRPARRLHLRRGQEVGERVEIVADADPSLGAGLQGRRAAPAERIEDDVARPRVACDERVGQGGREAREVRAHRVEGVAPQALLGLPFGLDADGRQVERECQGELRGACTRAAARRSGRHGRGRYLPDPPPIPVGAMGRGA